MKTLVIPKATETLAFDEELSVEFRRLPLRDLIALSRGGPIYDWLFAETDSAAADKSDEADADRPQDRTANLEDVLGYAEWIADNLVVSWTVAGPGGKEVPPGAEAARWLVTGAPDLANWMLNKGILDAMGVQSEIEQEKNG